MGSKWEGEGKNQDKLQLLCIQNEQPCNILRKILEWKHNTIQNQGM